MSKTQRTTAEAEGELRALKRAVRRFLDAISGVPMRAVDCDQDEVDEAWRDLAAMVKRR